MRRDLSAGTRAEIQSQAGEEARRAGAGARTGSLVIARHRDHLRGMENPRARFLDGQLLIAMPGMGDLRFERSVIFLCAHSRRGGDGADRQQAGAGALASPTCWRS